MSAFWKNSKWITAGDLGCNSTEPTGYPSPIFRGNFTVDNIPESAELQISCVGLGVVWVNGIPVTEDVMTTPFTCYDKRVFYNRYDIRRLLRCGKNTLSVMLGNGMYNDVHQVMELDRAYWRAIPRFSARIIADNNTILSSNSKFKCTEGPITYNHARLGEIYDARMEHKGWQMPEFDDSQWNNAVVSFPPGGILEENPIDYPVRILESTPCKKLNNGIFDCGFNTSGWVEVKFKANEGDRFTISYAETINSDGTLNRDNLNKFNSSSHPRHVDIFISGGGVQSWHPVFVYHGFRYVQVDGPSEPIEVIAHTVANDIQTNGNFNCSDDLLNDIHNLCLRSIRTNWMNIPTDTPGRCQGAWTGDACVAVQPTLLNFDIGRLYEKWVWDLLDVQRPSGQLPGIAPIGGWTYNNLHGPAWDSALVMIPYYSWMYTGSLKEVKTAWSAIVSYLDYMEYRSEDGTIDFKELGDWNPYKTYTDTNLLDTAFWYQDLMAASEMAEALGIDGAIYRDKATNVRDSFRRKFFENGQLLIDTPCAIACVLYYDLSTPEEAPNLLEKLIQRIESDGWHFDCGIYGVLFIPEVLSKYGRDDVVLKVLHNMECPGYGWWVANGETALCERWDREMSHNHQMFCAIDQWFYRYVAGICYEIIDSKPVLILNPRRLTDVNQVSASTRDVSVEITETEYRIRLSKNAILNDGSSKKLLAPGEYTIKI